MKVFLLGLCFFVLDAGNHFGLFETRKRFTSSIKYTSVQRWQPSRGKGATRVIFLFGWSTSSRHQREEKKNKNNLRETLRTLGGFSLFFYFHLCGTSSHSGHLDQKTFSFWVGTSRSSAVNHSIITMVLFIRFFFGYFFFLMSAVI